MTTSTKAIAAAISGPLVVIASYYVGLIPHFGLMPQAVQAAFLSLVASGIPALLVWHAPANKQTVSEPKAE